MTNLIVVPQPGEWPVNIPNVEIITPKTYILDPAFSQAKGVRVYNLSRNYRYQSLGYYVSLLAAARGHHPMPNVMTIQDLKNQAMIRWVSEELDEIIQSSLKPLQTREFTLSIYFGRNLAKKYDRLSRYLFNQFPAPMLRAHFVWNQKWTLQQVSLVSGNEIPPDHHDFLHQVASDFFEGKRLTPVKKTSYKYNMAILHDPEEEEPPSDDRALKRIIKAADNLGILAELVTKEDSAHILEFDALFIRETTSVNHHTYRLARKAHAEGLVVIDDPQSILRCTNKVYLAELLQKNKVLTPQTATIHKDNLMQVLENMGLPCILKQPDSSFSQGVKKAETQEEYLTLTSQLLEKSDLIVAQRFMPTPYDWRIGIFNKIPLFACKYYMAESHWQIIQRSKTGKIIEGKSNGIPIDDVPDFILAEALKAANLVGDGLYGVDLKEVDRKAYVIEVNDNPNLDSGVEDVILQQGLYDKIMNIFLERLQQPRK